MKRSGYAYIEWAVEDVMEKADELEIEITEEDAEKLLVREERHIEDAMVAAGWDILEGALIMARAEKIV